MTNAVTCDHHWHLDTGDRPGGRRVEVEIKTSGNPGWPVICCRCGTTSHRTAGAHACFGRIGVGPALASGPVDPAERFLAAVDDARIRSLFVPRSTGGE